MCNQIDKSEEPYSIKSSEDHTEIKFICILHQYAQWMKILVIPTLLTIEETGIVVVISTLDLGALGFKKQSVALPGIQF